MLHVTLGFGNNSIKHFPPRPSTKKERKSSGKMGQGLVSCGNLTQHSCVSPGVLAQLLSAEKLNKVDQCTAPGDYCPECAGNACIWPETLIPFRLTERLSALQQ